MKKLLTLLFLGFTLSAFGQVTNGTLVVTFVSVPVNQGQTPFFGLNGQLYHWVASQTTSTDIFLDVTTNACATNLFNMLGSNFPSSVAWSSSNWLNSASFQFVAASNSLTPLLSGNYASVLVVYPSSGGGGGITAATATNIAAYQAKISTNTLAGNVTTQIGNATNTLAGNVTTQIANATNTLTGSFPSVAAGSGFTVVTSVVSGVTVYTGSASGGGSSSNYLTLAAGQVTSTNGYININDKNQTNSSWIITSRDQGSGITNISIPTLTPLNTGGVSLGGGALALDLVPAAGAPHFALGSFYGVTWQDLCDMYILGSSNTLPFHVLRQAIDIGGNAYITTVGYNGATAGNLNIGWGGSTYMFANSTAGMQFAYPIYGTSQDMGYSGGEWGTAYLSGLAFSSGSNKRTGKSVLSSGTVNVANTSFASGDYLILTQQGTVGSTDGLGYFGTNGVGFKISSGNASSTNIVNWMIYHQD